MCTSVCFGLHIHVGAFIYELFFLKKCVFTYSVTVNINHSDVRVRTVQLLSEGSLCVCQARTIASCKFFFLCISLNNSRGNMRTFMLLCYSVEVHARMCVCVLMCARARVCQGCE